MNPLSRISSLQNTPRRLVGVLLTLVLIVTGCNLPGKSSVPVQQNTPTIAELSPSPTSMKPIQTSSLNQILYGGVEDGTWSTEEGILTSMRFLAGEISSDAAFGDTTLKSTEGSGVIFAAQAYVQTGKDEVAKAEIQRYLDMLMPSDEILDKISRPAQQSNTSTHLAKVIAVQDTINCQEHWANSFRTPVPGDVTCLLFQEQTVRGTNIRIYYPEYWRASNPNLRKIPMIMEAASRSVELYNGYGPAPIDTVKIVLTDLAFFNEGRYRPSIYAAAYDHSFTAPLDGSYHSQCRVGIFPQGLTGNEERVQQTIAHEMFHCYQYKNLRPQSIGTESIQHYNGWWMEGSAEFFGAVVYPDYNDEFQFNSHFQANAPFVPLFAMDYENYLFFQYLAIEGGLTPEGVIDTVLATMPTMDGFDRQQDALANVSGIEDIFYNFARDYMDKRLTDWGGGPVVIEPDFVNYLYYGEGSHEELSNPPAFMLGLYHVTFDNQTKFTITHTEEGEPGRHSMRPDGFTGAWQPIPSLINTVCDPPNYILVVTSARKLRDDRYQVMVSADGEHQESDICDECLHGTWELDNNSDFYFMDVLYGKVIDYLPLQGLDTSGTDAWLADVGGQMLINFTDDGEASGTQADYFWTVNAISYEHPGTIIAMTEKFNGGGTASYTLQESPEEEKWISFSNGEFDITNQITFMGRPLQTVSTGGSNTSIFLSSPARYQCSEDTLLYTTMPNVGTLIFHRVPYP